MGEWYSWFSDRGTEIAKRWDKNSARHNGKDDLLDNTIGRVWDAADALVSPVIESVPGMAPVLDRVGLVGVAGNRTAPGNLDLGVTDARPPAPTTYGVDPSYNPGPAAVVDNTGAPSTSLSASKSAMPDPYRYDGQAGYSQNEVNPETPAPYTPPTPVTPAATTVAPVTPAATTVAPVTEKPADNSWVAPTINTAGNLISGGLGLWAANKQAEDASGIAKAQSDAQVEAARIIAAENARAQGVQREIYDQNVRRLDPYNRAGVDAVGRLNNLAPFQYTQADLEASPGYAFRWKEGMKGVQNSAAARGGLLSGATMKSMVDYSQGMASQERQFAYNNYLNNQSQQQWLASLGENAAAQTGNYGQNYANSAGNLISGSGTAQANGLLGSANSMANGATTASNARTSGYVGGINNLNAALSGIGNYYQGQEYLKRLPQYGGTK